MPTSLFRASVRSGFHPERRGIAEVCAGANLGSDAGICGYHSLWAVQWNAHCFLELGWHPGHIGERSTILDFVEP
jgi:hypothetical protein